MTRNRVRHSVPTEEAQWHQTLVEILERETCHHLYDIAIQAIDDIGACLIIRYVCVPKEGQQFVAKQGTVVRVACVAPNAKGAPSSVVWSNIIPSDLESTGS